MLKSACSIVTFFSLSLCFLLAACLPPFRPAPQPIIPRSQEEIVAALVGNPNRFPTFRSWIKATLAFPQERGVKQQSFDAALLYQEAQQLFRLQGMDILGRTHFDLVYRLREMTLYLPPSSTAFHGDPSEMSDTYDSGIFFILRKTVEGLGPHVDSATVSFPDTVYTPVVTEDANTFSVIEIDPEALLMKRRTVLVNHKKVGEIYYEEYKPFGSDLLPTRISVRLPAKKVSFEFSFESLSIERSLPDNLFQITTPPETRWLPLNQLQVDFLF